MTDKRNATRVTLLFTTGSAFVLQTLVMILLATDNIATGVAVPLLAIVGAFGLLPAMAYIKSNT